MVLHLKEDLVNQEIPFRDTTIDRVGNDASRVSSSELVWHGARERSGQE